MKNLFLLLLLFVLHIGKTQVVTVKDIETGEVIHDASFISNSPSRFLETNTLGQVDISYLSGPFRSKVP
jgi:hypothetical protein